MIVFFSLCKGNNKNSQTNNNSGFFLFIHIFLFTFHFYSHHVQRVDLHTFRGDLVCHFFSGVFITYGIIDLVETFEGSEADGTHGLCHLVVGDGIGILFHVVTDVARQEFTVIAAP